MLLESEALPSEKSRDLATWNWQPPAATSATPPPLKAAPPNPAPAPALSCSPRPPRSAQPTLWQCCSAPRTCAALIQSALNTSALHKFDNVSLSTNILYHNFKFKTISTTHFSWRHEYIHKLPVLPLLVASVSWHYRASTRLKTQWTQCY